MNKNSFAPTPPMGWNSYDYYNTSVTEASVRANAEYMAAHLKQAGWEYVVIDIEWYSYDTGTQPEYQYIPFGRVEMDEHSRLIPCPDKFPSSAGGKGFKPLADYIHSLGLKFGIHIMRGVPRAAAHEHSRIMGTDVTADRIADPSNICFWNPDMYGVRPELAASQAYYDSIFELYASWGVDFVKCDDICREDMPTAHEEIRMLHEAIQKSGRPIVLSLSPGPAKIAEAEYYAKNANMWRITDDFWDTWPLLKEMFRRCDIWQGRVSPGCYPDCDMLPIGKIGKFFGNGPERPSNLTPDEQKLMMTLWCIFGSPLMIGGELTLLTERERELLTNADLLAMSHCAENARQIRRSTEDAVWASYNEVPNCAQEDKTLSEAADSASKNVENEAVVPRREGGISYIAVFNLDDEERGINVWNGEVVSRGFEGFEGRELTELFSGQRVQPGGSLAVTVPAHGVKVYSY